MAEWISVKDRLPEEYGTYIVTTARSAKMVATYYPRAKNWNTQAKITYWMHWPEPPKEDGNA